MVHAALEKFLRMREELTGIRFSPYSMAAYPGCASPVGRLQAKLLVKTLVNLRIQLHIQKLI